MICVRESARVDGLGRADGLAIGNGIQTVENEQQAWARCNRSDKDKAAAQQKRHWRFWACATNGKFSGRFGVRSKRGNDRDARAAHGCLRFRRFTRWTLPKRRWKTLSANLSRTVWMCRWMVSTCRRVTRCILKKYCEASWKIRHH